MNVTNRLGFADVGMVRSSVEHGVTGEKRHLLIAVNADGTLITSIDKKKSTRPKIGISFNNP